MSRKSIFYIVFFTVLSVGFFLVLKAVIPGYGVKRFQVLNDVRPFGFTDQYGRRITEQHVSGKVYVVEYFFTTCTGICPKLNDNMKVIHEKFKNEANFMILSHTCNPETDSVEVLKKYADSLGIKENDNWLFLTGSKDSLYYAARMSYLLDDPKNNVHNIEEQFLHTQFFALVDKNGKLRKKIYDGLKKKDIAELEEDIRTLIREPETTTRFVNNIFGN